jgi:deoxyribonuclease-4
MKKEKILLGAHISIADGLHKAILRGEEIGCTAIQIFTKSSRSWFAKKLSQKEIEKFKKTRKESKQIKMIVAHTSYLINLAAANAVTEKKSITSLAQELERCEELEIPYLVLHPGSHVGLGEEKGMKKIAKNLDKVLSKSKGKTKIALETTAGQGTNLGYTFKQLKKIRSLCKQKSKIAVCLDTCHVFAAGYDFKSPEGYKKVMAEFIKTLGVRSLKVIHINDSKSEFDSRVDRHENIGKGKIPRSVFKAIMNDKRLINVPKILETPIQDPTDYVDEIKMLRRMIK